MHAVGGQGPVVLTERTDVLTYGRLRVQFWVYGHFEVNDGRITVWRDSFDWLAVTRAAARGLAGCVLPALRAKPPAGAAPASALRAEPPAPAAAPAADVAPRPADGSAVLRIVADLQSPDPARSARFYTELFGLEVVMDLGWVVTLAHPDRPEAQLTLASGDATAIVAPEVSVHVADVDAAYRAALAARAEVLRDLTDEPWGVRRFLVRDPDGHVVNVLAHG